MITNRDFCIPYQNGNTIFIYFNGKIVNIQDNGKKIYNSNEDIIKDYAKKLNTDYDLYSGYTDTHILIDACEKIDCAACPFLSECEEQKPYINN